jgi:hypothetical protein
MKREIERANAECKDAPKVAPYHDNMKLCPGQNRSLYDRDPEPRHRSVNPQDHATPTGFFQHFISDSGVVGFIRRSAVGSQLAGVATPSK